MTLAERARSKNASYVLKSIRLIICDADRLGGPLQKYSTAAVSLYAL